jgi:hypothetical protein
MTAHVLHPSKRMPLPRILARAALTAALSMPLAGAAQGMAGTHPPSPTEVVIDGVGGEWDGVPYAFRAADGQDEPGPRYARIQAVKVRHDADAVYVALWLNGPFALQGMPGTLSLLLDEDADPATGWVVHGMRGVDAAIEFSAALGPGGARMGVGLRLMHAEGRASCVGTANVAEVTIAPSHASRWHEVRIPRGEFVAFGGRMVAGLVSVDSAGGVVDRTDVFTVDLADARPRAIPPGHGTADPLARAPGTDFRVVSWNVGREDFFEQPDAFGALLRPLAPDLLMLDEVAGGHSLQEVEDVLNHVLPGKRSWRAVYGISGGSQRGVIATRGSAPRIVAPFTDVLPYPDAARLLVPANAAADARAWLASRMQSYVPATGAVAEVGGRRILAVTVDLESGGTPGSAKDRLRDTEADAIRDATEAALAATVREEGLGGLLIAGDLNLVGTAEPLERLMQPAADGPPLAVALPLRLDGASAATWENPEEPFVPGRLDYVLYAPAFMAVAGGFVFRAADLSPAWLARHGLKADASRVTDHLPVVTDLRWVDRPR